MAVRVSQDAVEAAVALAAPVNVRVSQDVVECVVAPLTNNVRVSQEVVEVVQPYVPPEEANGWVVRTGPIVRWGKHGLGGDDNDGILTEDPNHPRGTLRVTCTPRITWGSRVADTANRWFVNAKPKISWVTGPGTASTECISGDGVVPPPEEPPAESLEQNYVF